MTRHPDEIMSILDQAQKRLGNEFNLRDLLWEILEDVLDSVELAIEHVDHNDLYGIIPTVENYLTNHYGGT